MIKMAWKVYGFDGHRQRESFNKSWRFKNPDKNVIVEIDTYSIIENSIAETCVY